MTESTTGYAVFLFEQATEALGDAIKPYVQDGTGGPHIACHAVDTGGAFVEMTVQAQTPAGEDVEIELMVPAQMVRMIVSTRSDEAFGFVVRGSPELRATPLPVVGPDAPPPRAPSAAVPATSAASIAGAASATADDRRRPPEG